MSAREEGRGAAQRLLHTDPLSKESVDMIADAVMDAFAPGHRAEVLRDAAREFKGLTPGYFHVNDVSTLLEGLITP